MCICSCIEYDAIVIKSYFLHFIDELTFNIALIIIYLYIRIFAL